MSAIHGHKKTGLKALRLKQKRLRFSFYRSLSVLGHTLHEETCLAVPWIGPRLRSSLSAPTTAAAFVATTATFTTTAALTATTAGAASIAATAATFTSAAN
jgi:hypothetical protein